MIDSKMVLSKIVLLVCVYLGYVIVCRYFLPRLNDLVPTYPGNWPLIGLSYMWLKNEITLCLLVWVGALTYWRAQLAESHAHPLPPAYPGGLPIIGHTHMLLTDTSKLLQLVKDVSKWMALQKEGVIYLIFGSQIYYHITDPEDALLVSNTCLEKHFMYSFAKCILGEGLITGSGDHWHRHRKLLKSNFSLPIINGYLEVFNSQSRAFLSHVENYVGKGKFDPSTHLKHFTLGTSYLTTFGKVGNEKCYQKYIKAVDEMLCHVMRRFQMFWLQNEFIYNLSAEKKTESEFVRTANEVTDEVLQTKRSFLNGTNVSSSTYVSYQPLIDLILQQHHRNKFTDQEITEELHTSIAAAYETTTHSLENILVMIGSYPKVQEKIYEEIMHVSGTDGDIQKDDLRKLVYTDAVIKESLRVIPTVPVTLRFIDRDLKLKNYTLRAGSQCIISNIGLLQHPSWGPDAELFRPERWLDTATLPAATATDAAFSFGKRSCLGKTYAMTSMKVAVAHMVRKYIITGDHTKLRFNFDITIRAVSGHEISLQRRSI